MQLIGGKNFFFAFVCFSIAWQISNLYLNCEQLHTFILVNELLMSTKRSVYKGFKVRSFLDHDRKDNKC